METLKGGIGRLALAEAAHSPHPGDASAGSLGKRRIAGNLGFLPVYLRHLRRGLAAPNRGAAAAGREGH